MKKSNRRVVAKFSPFVVVRESMTGVEVHLVGVPSSQLDEMLDAVLCAVGMDEDDCEATYLGHPDAPTGLLLCDASTDEVAEILRESLLHHFIPLTIVEEKS